MGKAQQDEVKVICRIGSLEINGLSCRRLRLVICRIGSLEMLAASKDLS